MAKKPKAKMGRPKREGGLDPPRSIRVPDGEWEQWRQAAGQAGITAWARDILNRACKRALRK